MIILQFSWKVDTFVQSGNSLKMWWTLIDCFIVIIIITLKFRSKTYIFKIPGTIFHTTFNEEDAWPISRFTLTNFRELATAYSHMRAVLLALSRYSREKIELHTVIAGLYSSRSWTRMYNFPVLKKLKRASLQDTYEFLAIDEREEKDPLHFWI